MTPKPFRVLFVFKVVGKRGRAGCRRSSADPNPAAPDSSGFLPQRVLSTVDGQNPACPYIPKLWDLWYYTILGSCRILSINSTYRVECRVSTLGITTRVEGLGFRGSNYSP